MRILGFDTATSSTSVALVDLNAGIELEARDDPAPSERPRHATALLPLIVELLRRSGAGWESIDRIAVGVGPGTFTGLRIGVSTARALGQARGIPVFGVCTLHALAQGASARGPEFAACDTALAVLDARRGEAFAAAWRLGGGARDGAPALLTERLQAPCALKPTALEALVAALGGNPLAIGSGAVEFRQALQRPGARVPADDSVLHRVSSLHHCRLAAGFPSTLAGREILPQYLRLPDAELARRRP